MAKQSPEGERIEAYIAEHLQELNREVKPLGIKSLAKKYLKEYAQLYDLSDHEKEVERVRSLMRGYLGRKGQKEISSKRFDIRDRNSGETQPDMPESEMTERKPFILEPGILGVLSDVHVPYHNPHAIACAVKYMKDKGVNQILLNGDILDFWKLSRFVHVGKKPDTVEELKRGREFLAWLRFQFPEIPIYYKLGNHEKRWEIYLWSKGGEIAHAMQETWGANLGLNHFLKLGQFNIQMLEDWKVIEAGKLSIIHGHEFGGSFFNPVNAARGLFMRAKSSVLAGHNHQTSEHQEGNIKGDSIACWSTGCLCELSPEYRPMAFTKWNLGAAIVEHNEDGQFFVDNFRIIKGSDGYRIA